MLRNSLYYRVKPMLPMSLRWAVRRSLALRKRPSVKDCWPILPGSERPPAGWKGWPNGKQFAFVLTHDVEGPSGLGKCRQLLELERGLGFRSIFNFIPEGPYRVPRQLRDEINNAGFEVGVHDLHHDGKLYQGRRDFIQKAARINAVLKDWGSVGFRSGFMLHNLDWLLDLNISYDLSTFDTDPFEPQPDNRNTIFPFTVSRNGVGGYVEMPYTLPQDSTLFLLLRETSTSIWMEKLDWIVRNGGMALVDVHPDYVDFDGESDFSHTYPASLYRQFLQHVRNTYGDTFWHPLPRELAEFAAPLRLPAPRRRRRVCMVTYSDFTTDARVSRYANALAQRGDDVDVFALNTLRGQAPSSSSNGVNLFCLGERHSKKEKSAVSYLLPILRFLGAASARVARNHWRRPYDLFHIHNMPDFLILAAAWPRALGAKVILDIHDIVPEFYASKFNITDQSSVVRVLKWLERFCSRIAHHVIISNHLWSVKYSARTGANGKCSVFINNVDSTIFCPRPRTRNDDKFIIIFPGGLQWHQGVDIALRAFRKILPQIPNAEFHIYGDGAMKGGLINLAKTLELEGKVTFFDPVPMKQVAEVMANADLGVVPKRADSFGNQAYSTKIMEFMSVNVPVICSSTEIDRYYFNDQVVRFFPSGDDDALAAAMLEVIRNPEARRRLSENGATFASQHNWSTRKGDYLALVDSLCSPEGACAHS
jgi:glycosyltransferase involved in cell wall biosynthesis